jgi:hypothetical protein
MRTLSLSSVGLALALASTAPAEQSRHRHEAPHGGTLVALGDELAHLELVLDADSGELTAYVLDGEAERGLPIAQDAIALRIAAGDAAPFAVRLAAVENVLTGETVGRTSQFAARDPRLQGLAQFEATIDRLALKGQVFENVRFAFPEGNEPAGHGAPAGDGHGDRAPTHHDHPEEES